MCTIVFIPNDEGFYLAHNRDESPKRQAATAPEWVNGNRGQVKMPIDGAKRGTWIYGNENETVFLFNGAFEKHKHNPPYSRSRGLVMTESLAFDSHEDFISNVDLQGVEPFTQVFIHYKSKTIMELVWDGESAHVRKREWAPFIYSSSTLYNESKRNQKEHQFERWLQSNDAENILNFMQDTTSEVPIILKHPLVETLSTTLIQFQNGEFTMQYLDYRVVKF